MFGPVEDWESVGAGSLLATVGVGVGVVVGAWANDGLFAKSEKTAAIKRAARTGATVSLAARMGNSFFKMTYPLFLVLRTSSKGSPATNSRKAKTPKHWMLCRECFAAGNPSHRRIPQSSRFSEGYTQPGNETDTMPPPGSGNLPESILYEMN